MMRKNSGDRSMSAALQHRRMSGTFEKARAEKLHSHAVNGRSPTMKHRARGPRTGSSRTQNMGMASSLCVGFIVASSMFVVSYAAVLSAMADEDQK